MKSELQLRRGSNDVPSETQPKTSIQPLRLLTPEQCARSPRRGYVIKGLIAPNDVGIIFGQPGAGKSVLGPHLGYAVAQGRKVFGRRVKQGKVFYVPAEDPHGMKQRIHALKEQHGDAPDFLFVEGVGSLFAEGTDYRQLTALVESLRPCLLVVDTIAAAFPGLKENDSEDMARVIFVARTLARLGCAVVLLHHAPKGDDSTPRGHGNLNGDADVSIRLTPDKEGTTVWAGAGKNRNGQSGALFSFSVRGKWLGIDDDGDPITAPIADEMEETRRPDKPPLTKSESAAVRFLADLTLAAGKPLPKGPDWPTGLHGVTEDAWRDTCESRRLSTAETAKDRRKIFGRTYASLLTKAAVAARDGWVWLTHPDEVGDKGDKGGQIPIIPPTEGGTGDKTL